MKRAPNYDDVMPLTEREVRILVALCSAKNMSGYNIGRQVEEDAGKNMVMGNGTLRPALDRLDKYGMIENVGVDKSRPGLPARIWRVTSQGRMILEWELASYRRLVRLGEGRL